VQCFGVWYPGGIGVSLFKPPKSFKRLRVLSRASSADREIKKALIHIFRSRRGDQLLVDAGRAGIEAAFCISLGEFYTIVETRA
jgi:hypothetical protein